jgi:predicted nucleic acid binding AN1-type Zn finger protein
MVRDAVSQSDQSEAPIKANKRGFTPQQAQEMIYQFLLNLVRKQPPAIVLREFKQLFIDYDSCGSNAEVSRAVAELIFTNNEHEFRNTLKRSCYILVNNWDTSRNHSSIKELVDLFADLKINKKSLSSNINRLRTWLVNFVNSQDYYDLKLFLAKYGYSDKEHWSHRYTSYLLVPQYTNFNNPIEQREAARSLSRKLKDQFKFDLAMYTARSQSVQRSISNSKVLNNPTGLGEEVLRFIKMIVAKRGTFSYENLAHIFLQQTKNINYKHFKHCLQNYLIFSVAHKDFVEVLSKKLSEKLELLYESYQEEVIEDALLLRTCNRVIEYLTTEDQNEPSGLFILLLSQGNPLTLVIVLLKIILICPNARTHLENCIAKLIQYYVGYPEEDCQWVVNFFEVFNITFAIHAGNVQYNLIKMEEREWDGKSELAQASYRVFSQLRAQTLEIEPEILPESTEENLS